MAHKGFCNSPSSLKTELSQNPNTWSCGRFSSRPTGTRGGAPGRFVTARPGCAALPTAGRAPGRAATPQRQATFAASPATPGAKDKAAPPRPPPPPPRAAPRPAAAACPPERRRLSRGGKRPPRPGRACPPCPGAGGAGRSAAAGGRYGHGAARPGRLSGARARRAERRARDEIRNLRAEGGGAAALHVTHPLGQRPPALRRHVTRARSRAPRPCPARRVTCRLSHAPRGPFPAAGRDFAPRCGEGRDA